MSGFNTIPPNPFPPSTDEDGTQAAQIKHLQEDVSALRGNVSTLSTTKANQATIAPSFSAETGYSIGDIVYYEGVVYRCTNAHEGEWDADDFAATTISDELDELKSGLIKFVTKTITTTNGIGQIPDLNTTNHIVVSVKTTGATVMYWDGANTNWYVTLVNPSDLSIVSTERTQTYIIGYVDV